MVVKNYDNRIIESKKHRGGNKFGSDHKINLLELSKDIKANGSGFVRSRTIAVEVCKIDDNIFYSYVKEDDLFELIYDFSAINS